MATPTPQSLDDLPDTPIIQPPGPRAEGGSRYRRGHWAWAETRRVQTWNPIDTPASWMTAEVQAALDAIEDAHGNVRKKRTTVLRLAEAKALGLPMRGVFDLEDTCNAQTWYGGKGQPGWRDDLLIQAALEAATKRAQWWQDQEEAQRLALRQRQLALTQDELIDLTKLSTETLADLMMNAASDKARLEAAVAVLDRAAGETAKKIVSDMTISEGKGPTMAQIRDRKRQREAAGPVVVVQGDSAGEVTVAAGQLVIAAGQEGGDDGVEWVVGEEMETEEPQE